jgi:hypothetical protein
MIRNNFLLLLYLVLTLFSCSKDKDKDLDLEQKQDTVYSIIGEWEWYSSYFYGYEHTPENDRINFSLFFAGNDTVIIIENSDTVFKAEYLIEKEIDDYGKEIDVLHFISDTIFCTDPAIFNIGPQFDRYIIRYLTDTLKLKEYYFIDGFHSFKRKK